MIVRQTVVLLLILSAFNYIANSANAFGCCAGCGCKADCCKVCRLVKEEKKVSVICWGMKCEDFCIPGPSDPCCKNCEILCDDCDEEKQGKDEPHGAPKRFIWRDWIPSCYSTVHTKTKLMQKIVTKKVPSYKWVVEDLCDNCEKKAESAKPEPGEKAPPPPPVPDAKIKK